MDQMQGTRVRFRSGQDQYPQLVFCFALTHKKAQPGFESLTQSSQLCSSPPMKKPPQGGFFMGGDGGIRGVPLSPASRSLVVTRLRSGHRLTDFVC